MVDRKESYVGSKKEKRDPFGSFRLSDFACDFTRKLVKPKNVSVQEYEQDADLLVSVAEEIDSELERKRKNKNSNYNIWVAPHICKDIGYAYFIAANLSLAAAKKAEELGDLEIAKRNYKKTATFFNRSTRYNTDPSNLGLTGYFLPMNVEPRGNVWDDESLRFAEEYSLKKVDTLKREGEKRLSLEQSLSSASLSIISILIGLFFLSKNFFNYSVQLSPGISEVTNSGSFWLGVVLIFVGVVAGFFYFKKKKEEDFILPIQKFSVKSKKKVKKRK